MVFPAPGLAEDVAAEEFATGQPIADPAREREVVDLVSRSCAVPVTCALPTGFTGNSAPLTGSHSC
jgi:hypothetical protein